MYLELYDEYSNSLISFLLLFTALLFFPPAIYQAITKRFTVQNQWQQSYMDYLHPCQLNQIILHGLIAPAIQDRFKRNLKPLKVKYSFQSSRIHYSWVHDM